MVSSWAAIHYRHRKNQEAVQQLLGRLRDNREQQHFLQDCQEVRLSSLVPLWHFLAIHPLRREDFHGFFWYLLHLLDRPPHHPFSLKDVLLHFSLMLVPAETLD